MRRMSTLALCGLLLLGSGGCAFFRGLFGGDEESEVDRRIAWARSVASEPRPDAEALARAGWVQLLYANDHEGARVTWERFQSDPELTDEVEARAEASLGLGEVARARLSPREAAAAYLEVLTQAPASSVAAIAQSRLTQLFRLESGMDSRIAAALDAVIAHPGVTPGRRVEAERQRQALLLARGDLEAAILRAKQSQPDAMVVIGPFSRYRALRARRAFDPELEPLRRTKGGYAALQGAADLPVKPAKVPVGPVGLHLTPLSRWGDVWYALTDLLVPEGEKARELLLTWESGRDLRLVLDGTQLMRRDALEGREPTRGVIPLRLTPGRHRLAIRFLRRVGEGAIRISVLGADGRPTQVDFDPDHLDQEIAEPYVNHPEPDERDDLGEDPVTWFWTGLHEAERDPARARRALRRFIDAVPASGLGHLHAVQVLTADPDLGASLATGRMAQHLQKASALIPELAATWAVQGAFSFEQSHDARARESFTRASDLSPDSPRLAEIWARYLLERGHAVLAERALDHALSLWPDACSLWRVAYQVRTDEESLAAQDAAAERLRGCGTEGIDRWASHQAERGERTAALEARRRLLTFEPDRVHARLDLARVLVSLEKIAEADAVLAESARFWPEEDALLRARARLADRLGKKAQARTLRRALLHADPGAMEVRLSQAFGRDEKLLAWGARDLEAQIADYLESGQALRAGANAVEVVDHAVSEVFLDDARRPVVIERIQSVTEVLTKEGLDRYGEVSLPGRAEVLELYVRKPDGRRLYPDAVMGRESLSLPGLEPGDFIVTDILTQVGSRGAALPGWSANAFYFRIYELPLYRSSYVLRAPVALPMEVDAHQLEVEAPVVEDGFRYFRHSVTNAEALHPEAGAPGSPEILPWIRVGSGSGPLGYGWIWGDYVQGRDRPTEGMKKLARRIAREVKDSEPGGARALVLALAREVNQRISGNVSTTDFDANAAQIFSAGTGNRLLVLRALLRALEIESKIAFVRSFATDPNPYRFPGPRRYTHAVLMVPMAEGDPLWIDTHTRGAPLGTLRPVHSGQPVLLLATPEQNPVERRTPDFSPALEEQNTEVDAVLTEEGSLQLIGRELYRGHSGASVRVSLESMEPDRRVQAIQALLASYFGPVLLDTLEFENDTLDGAPGAPLTIHYAFEAPQWVQKSGERLVIPGAFFPMRLGRALLRHGSRELPLLLDRGSPTSVTVRLELPAGHGLVGGPPPPIKIESPFGTYEQQVSVTPEGLILRRSLKLPLRRVPAAEYQALADFLIQIDAAEATQLVVGRIQS